MKTHPAPSVDNYVSPPLRSSVSLLRGSRAALHDPRWPAVAAALEGLKFKGRFAVRIVDADCGAGSMLLQTVHHARMLGFNAIEGRGIDGSPALIGRARAAATRLSDPAIGIEFALADMVTALHDEFDFPADILLCHDARNQDRQLGIAEALSRAGEIVVGDHGPILVRRKAA